MLTDSKPFEIRLRQRDTPQDMGGRLLARTGRRVLREIIKSQLVYLMKGAPEETLNLLGHRP
jgi:hypothetical protein